MKTRLYITQEYKNHAGGVNNMQVATVYYIDENDKVHQLKQYFSKNFQAIKRAAAYIREVEKNQSHDGNHTHLKK